MPKQPDRHRASESRGSRRASRHYRWGSLRGGVGVSIIAASAALGAIITIAHRAQPGRVLGVCIVAGTVIAALAVRPRAGRLIFPVPVLAYLVGALIAGIAYNRSTSKAELVIGSAQWIANGFLLMALATGLAIVLVAFRWILRRSDRRAPVVPDRSGSATTGDRRDLPRSAGWSDPGSPAVPRQPGPQPGQRPPTSDGAGQRNGPYPGPQNALYPGQGYGQRPAQGYGQRPGQAPSQRPTPGNGQYSGPATEQPAGQRPTQAYGQYSGPVTEQAPDQRNGPRPGPGYGQPPEQRPGYGQYSGQASGQASGQGNPPRPGPGYGQPPEQQPGQGYGQYSGQASAQSPDQRNGSGPDRRYGTYPDQRSVP